MTESKPRTIHAPTGTELSCKGWQQEAALRMIMNNLDPEVAEHPDELIVYGGLGKAARNWESFDAIIRNLKDLEDDETMLVDMSQQILQRLGYQVTACTSSVEALQVFQNDPSVFDLIITDMTMPHMTGKELATAILKISPELPIILCTGFSETISEEAAKHIGIQAFILKPIVMSDLAVTMRKVLDGTP